MSRPPDLAISGSWGLYRIAPQTPRGKRWLAHHCAGERTWLDGALMCEGGDRCRAIVAAAVRGRLRVTVNGVDMAPQDRVAKPRPRAP